MELKKIALICLFWFKNLFEKKPKYKLDKKKINKVIDIIDNQVKEKGLIIEKSDLDREIFLFLCILEQWEGIDRKKRIFGVEQAEKDLDDRMDVLFKPFTLKNDVIQDEKKQKENQQKYTAHLEAVKKGIISLIFENKI